MAVKQMFTVGLVLASLALTTSPAFADHGRRDRRDDRRYDSDRRESRAVPRSRNYRGRDDRNRDSRGWNSRSRFSRPTIVNIVPYRPYSYSYRPYVYRPGLSLGLSYGSPYSGYRYPYGYNYSDGYSYPVPPAGYLSAVPGRAYGGVRITDAPRDAQVFADGYYMGIVDEFDGVFQHMNLEAGPHRIELRAPGFEPIVFDVNVQPGETITYRADLEPGRPY